MSDAASSGCKENYRFDALPLAVKYAKQHRGQLDLIDLASESIRIEALVSLVSSTQLRCDSHLGMCKANE